MEENYESHKDLTPENCIMIEPLEVTLKGYRILHKVAVSGGQKSAARVYVPKDWAGKECAVVLLEPLNPEE